MTLLSAAGSSGYITIAGKNQLGDEVEEKHKHSAFLIRKKKVV